MCVRMYVFVCVCVCVCVCVSVGEMERERNLDKFWYQLKKEIIMILPKQRAGNVQYFVTTLFTSSAS